MKLDTVLVGSAIHTFEKTVFSPEERLNQLLNFTIPSIRKYLPDAFIIVVEDSDISIEYQNKIRVVCDILLCINKYSKTIPQSKSFREVFSLCYALHFIPQHTERLFKLGGRYEWNERFNLDNFPNDKMCFIYHPPRNQYETCSFVVSQVSNIMKLIEIYNTLLKKYQNGYYYDTETNISEELLKLDQNIIKRFSIYNFGITIRQTNTIEPRTDCPCCPLN